MKSRRVTYRRHCSYATGSNRIRLVKTPGKLTPPVPLLTPFRWQVSSSLFEKEIRN